MTDAILKIKDLILANAPELLRCARISELALFFFFFPLLKVEVLRRTNSLSENFYYMSIRFSFSELILHLNKPVNAG
jgi:hypothetical protein